MALTTITCSTCGAYLNVDDRLEADADRIVSRGWSLVGDIGWSCGKHRPRIGKFIGHPMDGIVMEVAPVLGLMPTHMDVKSLSTSSLPVAPWLSSGTIREVALRAEVEIHRYRRVCWSTNHSMWLFAPEHARVFFLAECKQCGFVMPFGSDAACDRWARGHAGAAGHTIARSEAVR